MYTLFHIVDVEQAWINGLQGKPEYHYNFEDYKTLASIKELSDACRSNIQDYVNNWSKDIEIQKLDEFTYDEVIHHVIAHEIHHIGQLSIWARELGLKPISANLIGRNLE